MSANMRQLLKQLRDQGAELERGTDHWKVLRDGRLVQVLPVHGRRTRRTSANAIAQLRRAGFEL